MFPASQANVAFFLFDSGSDDNVVYKSPSIRAKRCGAQYLIAAMVHALLFCVQTAPAQQSTTTAGSTSKQLIDNTQQQNSIAERKVSIARFAKIPIVAVTNSNEVFKDSRSQQSTNSAATKNVEGTLVPPKLAAPIPSILTNTTSVNVNLDFVIMSSISSKKALLSFDGKVVIEPITPIDFDISAQARELALSQFDPNLVAFLIGNDINKPRNSFFGPGIQQQNQIDEAEFNARVSKTWQNGLISSVGYEPSLAYLFFPQGNASGFNPTHQSDLVTRLEQPLLRGAGRDVNLVNLRIVEWKSQQSQNQIELAILAQLRSIEEVYWRLHAVYVRLRAIDSVIRLAEQTLYVVRARYEAERVIYSDVARAEVKLEDLYQQHLAAELAIREASFSLAQLSGLDLDGRVLLVPTDVPVFNPPEFVEESVVASSIAYNPELKRQRQSVEIGRQTVLGAKNSLMPKLNIQALHRTSGIQDNLGSSLKQMTSLEFNDFSLGLQYSQQLGTRQARSQVNAAKLQVAREQAILIALERRVGFEVLQQLNKLKQIYVRYQSALRQVEQSKKWVEIARTRYEDPPVAKGQQESILVALVDYQTALQSQIDSIVLVANTLADYNIAIAVIDEKRGLLASKRRISTYVGEPQ